jgi:hypothetical protein
MHEPSVETISGEHEPDRILTKSCSPCIGTRVSKLPALPAIRLPGNGVFIAERFPYFLETRAGFEYRFESFGSLNAGWLQTSLGSTDSGVLAPGPALPIHIAEFR